MTAREHAQRLTFQVRRFVSGWWAFVVAVAFAGLLAHGFFQDGRHGSGPDLVRLTAAAGLASLLLARVLGRLGLGENDELESPWTTTARDLELGLLIVISTHVLLQFAGGLRSSAYPLAYAMVTFLAAYNRPVVGVSLVAISLGLEALTFSVTGQLAAARGELLTHVALSAFFTVVSLSLLRLEVAKLRREHASRLRAEIDGMREEARDFRLISATLTSSGAADSRSAQEQRLWHGAVESIHQAIYFSLELLKDTLELHSCALLWLDDRQESLSIKEMVTEAESVHERPFPAVSGVLGGVVKNRSCVSLVARTGGVRGIPYYAGPVQVGAFLGVPVLEEGHLRAVLCADRVEPRRFSETERELLERAARQIMHAIQAERVFCAVERSKYEQERFFRASQMLNSALGLEEVHRTAFAAAREIVDFDQAVITHYDAERGRHTIAAVVGEALEPHEGTSFADNAGLVAMAIKNRHYLPAGGVLRDRSQVVLCREIRLGGVESLIIIPLVASDHALGAFVLASRRRGLFTTDRRDMLGVIANQVAVSVQNALMYRRMEEMATTDGLTGLANHRTFQDRFSQMLARAERAGKPVSLILCDIDHFKSVNDTYGHPVGDAVLKAVARVLLESARVVDIVARYGGEEFALVLEDTDSEGALILAERVRTEIGRLRHASDLGPFASTMSLGIASYPHDGEHKQELIERADQSLYFAKEHGRNQAVRYVDIGSDGRSSAG